MCQHDESSGLEQLEDARVAARQALESAIAAGASLLPDALMAQQRESLDAYISATDRSVAALRGMLHDLKHAFTKACEDAARLEAENREHQRARFGTKSEKLEPLKQEQNPEATTTDAGAPDGQEAQTSNAESTTTAAEGDQKPEKPKKPRKPKTPKARAPDAYISHTPENLTCPHCGGALRIVDYDKSTRVMAYQAALKYIEESFAITSCTGCERVEQVPRAPNAFAGSKFDATVFSAISVAKYACSVSLYTLAKVVFWNEHELTRSAMSKIVIRGAKKFMPLWIAIPDFSLMAADGTA